MERKRATITFKSEEEAKDIYVLLPKNKFRGRFFIAMDEGFVDLARFDLTRHQYRVLLALIGHMEYGNWVEVTQTYIAGKIGMTQPHVSKAINELKELGLVFKEKTPKGQKIRVSSVIAWKGNQNAEYRKAFQRDSEFYDVQNITSNS